MKRILITTVAAIATLSALETAASAAGLTFNFDFSQNTPGSGFLDPTTGAQRQAALVEAGNRFSNLFGTYFTNSAVLNFTATSNQVGLAGAGTEGINAPGFGNGEVVRNKILSGGLIDLNGSSNDGFVNYNFADFDFQLDPNAPVNFNANQIDFYSVTFHELTHALGFGSNIPSDGSTPGAYSKWDQFLTNQAGTPVVNPGTMTVNLPVYMDAQTNGGLFSGQNANAAFGQSVPLTVDPDISHLNQLQFTPFSTTFSPAQVPFNALMRGSSSGPDNSVPRDYIPAEVGILTDLGYTPVPEPSTAAFGLIGVLGLLARRIRNKRA